MLEGHEYFQNLIPDFHYILIDVNRYSKDFLKNLSNTVGAIFLLDQKYDIIELEERLYDALPGIKTFELSAFETFKNWFQYIVCEQLPTEKKKSFLQILKQTSPKEADIMISNLAETIRDAQENAKNEGFKIGIGKGIEQGIDKGIMIVAKNMIRKKLPFKSIAEVTDLSLKQIIQLAETVNLEQV